MVGREFPRGGMRMVVWDVLGRVGEFGVGSGDVVTQMTLCWFLFWKVGRSVEMKDLVLPTRKRF